MKKNSNYELKKIAELEITPKVTKNVLELIGNTPIIKINKMNLKGTSGTLMGAGKRFKEYNPRIKVIGVEPELNHKIQGLKNMNEAIVPAIYDEKKLDKKVMVLTEDAYSTARELTKKKGLFVGMSAGAAMWVAIQEAKEMKKGKIVVLFPDRGEKYLSTVLFAPSDLYAIL